ncbi:MAG: SDR family NAD(P)-dependent oxidoreductase, partial [Alphaproteobacteria bacterium]
MNRIDLEGRKAVVTGGARGIGLATAERMLQSGAEVCLWDMDPAALDADEIELVVQVNGKLRGSLRVAKNADRAAI